MFKFRIDHLATRILIWAFIPTAIILTAVAITTFYAYQQVTKDLVVGRNEQLARFRAAQLAADLNQYVDALSALGRTADIYGGDPERQAFTLENVPAQMIVFDGGVLVLNPDGKVVAATKDRSQLLQRDWSTQAFFRQLIRTGKPAFSDIVQIGEEKQQGVAVAVPFTNPQGEYRGALVGLFRLGVTGYSAFYGGIVKLRLDTNGSTYLVDSTGKAVYHPEEQVIGTDLDTYAAVQQVMKGESGTLTTQDINRQVILASYAPVPGTPWGLISEESWVSLMSASSGYAQFLLILLAAGVAIPMLVVAVGVRRITYPIQKLIQAAKEIAGGQYGRQISVHTGDEMEELITQFNRMSTQLSESYSQLEQRVLDRTRQLAALNQTAAVASQSLNLEQILAGALDQTLKTVGLERGVAFDVDTPEAIPSLIVSHGISETVVNLLATTQLRGTILEAAGLHNELLTLPVLDIPESRIRESLESEGIRQVVCIPCLSKGKLNGAMLLGLRGEQVFSGEAASLLASIGQQVSLAIENAHLYNQAEKSAAAAERTRLARELHDSVTQSLYSVTLYAQAVAARMAAGDYNTATQHVKELGDTAQEALREMRLLIFELRPMELEKNGLAAALQSRLDSVEARGGMKSDLHVSGNLELPIPIQRELYHIAREALNNIFKHAHAHFVNIELAADDEQVRMEICDDGIGFDPDRIQPGGLGLPGIQERVDKIGGKLTIVSTPGSGTHIQIVVGLTAQQKDPTPDYQEMEF